MPDIEILVPLQGSYMPKTILIVDDSAFVRHLLTKMLDDETLYQPIFADTCADALEIASIIKPHLFLFDYQLPEMSGLDLYDILHARKALKHVPAIIMSTELPKHALEKRHLSGIEKPFHPSIFLHMIESIVHYPSVVEGSEINPIGTKGLRETARASSTL